MRELIIIEDRQQRLWAAVAEVDGRKFYVPPMWFAVKEGMRVWLQREPARLLQITSVEMYEAKTEIHCREILKSEG